MRDFYEEVAAAREARLSAEPATPSPAAPRGRIPAKVYGVMAFTTGLTFASLTTGYQYFFTHQLYA